MSQMHTRHYTQPNIFNKKTKYAWWVPPSQFRVRCPKLDHKCKRAKAFLIECAQQPKIHLEEIVVEEVTASLKSQDSPQEGAKITLYASQVDQPSPRTMRVFGKVKEYCVFIFLYPSIAYNFFDVLSPSHFVCPLFHFKMFQNIVLFLKIKVISLLIFLLYP